MTKSNDTSFELYGRLIRCAYEPQAGHNHHWLIARDAETDRIVKATIFYVVHVNIDMALKAFVAKTKAEIIAAEEGKYRKSVGINKKKAALRNIVRGRQTKHPVGSAAHL